MNRMRKPKEDSIQTSVCDYIRCAYPNLIFTAESSGIRLTIGQAKKAKRQRSQRGLPDLMILEPRGGFHGLMIELKREGQSPFKKDGMLKAGEHLGEQYNAIQTLIWKGYSASFCVGFDQAKEKIDWYMSLGHNLKRPLKHEIEQQVEIMETQLSFFENLMEKMQYMSEFFDLDPEFSKEARDIVRGNICKTLPR